MTKIDEQAKKRGKSISSLCEQPPEKFKSWTKVNLEKLKNPPRQKL